MLLFEFGLAPVYSNRYRLDAAKKCQNYKTGAIAGLNINNLAVAFLLLLMGYAVALLVFLGERLKIFERIKIRPACCWR